MQMNLNKIELTEQENEDFRKIIDYKVMWKDQSKKTVDTLSNGLYLDPIQTMSSYNLWMRRNLLLLAETEEFVYISGSNLIIDGGKSKKQSIIPLHADCEYTSLYTQVSSTGERYIAVGEKLKHTPRISGRVEIINIDNRNSQERIILDHSYYLSYESFVYDAVLAKFSDLCFTIVKNADITEQDTKVFIWDYTSISLISIEDFSHHVETLIMDPKNSSRLLVFNAYYIAVWVFSHSKKKMLLEHVYYDMEQCQEIADATFIKAEGFQGIGIAFKSHLCEIFTENNQKFLSINLIECFPESMIDKFSRASVNVSKQILPQRRISINPDENQSTSFIENEIPFPNFLPVESSSVVSPNFTEYDPKFSSTKNGIKYILSRDKYIFVFFTDSSVYMVFEFVEVLYKGKKANQMKLSSIDKLHCNLIERSYIGINSTMTKVIILNGDPAKKFYSKMSKVRQSMLMMQKHSRAGAKTASEFHTQMAHKLEPAKMSYYEYKIHFVNNTPFLIYEGAFLEFTGLGHEIRNMCISIDPRTLVINSGEHGKEILFYKQTELTEIDYKELSVQLKQVYESSESCNSNLVCTTTQMLKQKTYFSLIQQKTVEAEAKSVAISPMGNSFFVASKECGCLYTFLENEIKEVFKINLFCMASAYSVSGTYLAFSTSEYESDYNICIINVNTGEYEYIITKLPTPTKIVFIDNDRKLCVMFSDNTLNVMGWELNCERRLMAYNSNVSKEKDKDKEKEKEKEITQYILRIYDFSGNVMDFVYDHVISHCLILSEDHRLRIYNTKKEDSWWEIQLDGLTYTSCLLIKKFDCILFGTSLGSIRSSLWPISSFNEEKQIEHPNYTEKFIHSDKVTILIISPDLRFLYSSSTDGSVFVSCVHIISNDTLVGLTSLFHFDPRNILPKISHMNFSDLVNLNDNIYNSKIDAMNKKKFEIHTLLSEFTTEKEKIIQDNQRNLEKKRTEQNESLEKKIKDVKDQENEKETQTKILKEKRENKMKQLKDELRQIKSAYKIQKEQKQVQTKFLNELIKDSKLKFSEVYQNLENEKNEKNAMMKASLEEIFAFLINKKKEIEIIVETRKKKFGADIGHIEEKYEDELRERDSKFKGFQNIHVSKKEEYESEIKKIKKDNKVHNDKIKEWENHLGDLSKNNDELMEKFLFCTLKLKQMSQLLEDNETKITSKEKIVKEKRLKNDRLEMLRKVLDHQITNLINEKNPIEEQIKNFEQLHKDFDERLKSLLAEEHKIGAFITNNQSLIESYQAELSQTKDRLYALKTLYQSIEVEMQLILKNKIEDKDLILNQVIDIYNKHLKDYSNNLSTEKIENSEEKMQAKTIEKEINRQKNKILRDLIKKRQERKGVDNEKEDLMMSIRLDNQLLIEECSNIRLNLEDILKYITDIEKKFIELTNNNLFLHKNENTKLIRENIKRAKKSIMIPDADKTKIAKGSGGALKEKEKDKDTTVKDKETIPQQKIMSTKTAINFNSRPNLGHLDRKFEENREQARIQNADIEKIQQKMKEMIGNDINEMIYQNTLPNDNSIKDTTSARFLIDKIMAQGGKPKRKKQLSLLFQQKTLPIPMNKLSDRVVMQNLKNGRKLKIKSKRYYDSQQGGLKEKEIVSRNDVYQH